MNNVLSPQSQTTHQNFREFFLDLLCHACVAVKPFRNPVDGSHDGVARHTHIAGLNAAVLDAFLTEEPEARVACETFATTDRVVIGGEVRGPGEVVQRVEEIARTL